jgi:hypothetical protein
LRLDALAFTGFGGGKALFEHLALFSFDLEELRKPLLSFSDLNCWTCGTLPTSMIGTIWCRSFL